MRIVYIITRMDERGGPQIHIRDFALRLRDLGHDVFVISGSSGQMIEDLKNQNISCYIVPEMTRSIGFWREFRAIKSLRTLLKKIQPDLVSCHSSKAGVVGRLAAFLSGVPVIFTVHGWAFTENVKPLARIVYRMVEWVMARFCARIITVSDYDRALGRSAWIARSSHIVTIHNGMPDYPVCHRTSVEGPVRLIMVARFAPQKDHATLITALATLRHLPWVLSLAGNGETRALEEQVKLLNLEDRIHFLGQRVDIGDLLNQSDIFLLITHWEGFPRSIVEAMRAGLPTIATAVAGVPESVMSGQTGYLVPHADVQAVAMAVKDLIENSERRQMMGIAARRHYEQSFTFDHMFTKTIKVYEEVTGLPIFKDVITGSVDKIKTHAAIT